MATVSREERQLMRQRGAGSRNIPNADFVFNIGPQGSREERQLMRQRGAGNRKVNNIDFGFTFPTPSQPRRSASRTPQHGRKNINRSSKTPRRASRDPSATRSTREGSSRKSESRQEPPGPLQAVQISSAVAISAAKRRKLDEGGRQSLSASSLQSKRTPTARFAIAEEFEPEVEGSQPRAPSDARESLSPDSPGLTLGHENKENEDITTKNSKPMPKRKKRKSVVQHIGRKKKRTSAESGRGSTTVSIESDEPSAAVNQQDVAEEIQEVESPPDANVSPDTESRASSELQLIGDVGKSSKKRRKRKSVIMLPRRKRPSGNNHTIDRIPSPGATEHVATEKDSNSIEETVDHDEDEQPVETQERNVPRMVRGISRGVNRRIIERRRRRARLSVSTSPAPQEMMEREEDETYVEEEHSPEPATPAPRRKSKAKRNSGMRMKKPAQQKQGSAQSSFPILTHRMMNTHALPTIFEEGDHSQGSDNETAPSLGIFGDRTAPNGVDVLAQICREIVETAIEKLETHKDPSVSRVEVKRNRSLLESFGQDLDRRLFDMSEAVEHRLTMEARLRKSKRERAELQLRWMSIRRQRDELALKADAIRKQNWEIEEEIRQQAEISALAHRTELEMDREVPEEDLEFLLRTVADNISSAGDGYSILKRVKAFNSQLERIASSLGG